MLKIFSKLSTNISSYFLMHDYSMLKKFSKLGHKILNPRFPIFLIAVAFLAQFSLPSILAVSKAFAESVADSANGPKITYISSTNAPTIYGTSEITVPEGTKIDYKHDARFRVFARDNEDEDLTSKIVSTDTFSNNDTPPQGNYEIIHTVTDSNNNTTELKVPVHVTAKETTEIKLKKLMYTLPSVQHLNEVGHTRGNNHDRQMLGVYLDSGAELQIRKVKGTENVGLTASITNNDSRTEMSSDEINTVLNATKTIYNTSTNEGWATLKNSSEGKSLDDYNNAKKRTKQKCDDAQAKITAAEAQIVEADKIIAHPPSIEEKAKAQNNKRKAEKAKTEAETEKTNVCPFDEDTFRTFFVGVPTLRTLYDNDEKESSVEYEIKWDANNEKIKPLIYYHQGDGPDAEAAFKSTWEQDQPDSYAVVDGWSTTVVVPPTDKRLLVKTDSSKSKQFDTFDEYLHYWDQVTQAFDELIGLSYTPEYWWDQNIKTKFFVRANASGPGSAYYGSDCIGVTSTQVWSIFERSWGVLHEIGHGYQGSPGTGNPTGTNSLTEVTVNIFSYYIDTQRWSDIYQLGDHPDNWLNKASREYRGNGTQDDFIGMRGRLLGDTICNPSNPECKTIGAAAYLYVFVNLLDYFADLTPDEDGTGYGYADAYAAINKYFREIHHTKKTDLKIYDLWAKVLYDKYNVNVVPYFESWTAPMNQDLKDELMASDAKILFNLKDMVTNDSLATQMTSDLGNVGKYDIVSMEEAASSNLKGDLKITFQINDLNLIKGKSLALQHHDGSVTYHEVEDSTMTIKDLPVGYYRVAPPKGTTALDYENKYFLVSDNSPKNDYTIKYNTIDPLEDLNNISFVVSGFNPGKTPLLIDVKNDKLTITYIGTEPRSTHLKSDILFSTVSVFDADGNQLHSVSVNGAKLLYTDHDEDPDRNRGTYPFDVKPGYKLKIYYNGKHDEDFQITDNLTGQKLDAFYNFGEDHEITYVYDKNYGFIPEEISNDPEEAYKFYTSRIKDFADDYFQEVADSDYLNPFLNQKNTNRLLSLLDKFSDEDIGEYKTLATTGKAPEISLTDSKSYSYDEKSTALEKFKSELKKNLTIFDREEGEIPFEHDYVSLNTDGVDWNKPGVYKATLTVTDREGNQSTQEIPVTILAVSKPDQGNPDNTTDPTNPTNPDSSTDDQISDPNDDQTFDSNDTQASNSSDNQDSSSSDNQNPSSSSNQNSSSSVNQNSSSTSNQSNQNSQNPSAPDTGSNSTDQIANSVKSAFPAITISAIIAILTSAALLFLLFRRKRSK